jgi:hypothetical protein
LSKIAIRQFRIEGRGSFLIISEANPLQGVYLATQKLLDCIKQIIPEASNYVQNIMNDYDSQEQFVVINVFIANELPLQEMLYSLLLNEKSFEKKWGRTMMCSGREVTRRRWRGKLTGRVTDAKRYARKKRNAIFTIP